MGKYIGLIIFVLVVLGIFYLGERIVKVTKENPNETDTKLVGRGVAEAGIDATETIAAIGNRVINPTNTTPETTINETIDNISTNQTN